MTCEGCIRLPDLAQIVLPGGLMRLRVLQKGVQPAGNRGLGPDVALNSGERPACPIAPVGPGTDPRGKRIKLMGHWPL